MKRIWLINPVAMPPQYEARIQTLKRAQYLRSNGFDVVIMGFIFGTFAIGFSPGGLGAYPYAIASVFFLYGIPKEIGTAFGYLVWTSQTLLTIVLGILSYILLPILNKK
jgi:hypothetical protein